MPNKKCTMIRSVVGKVKTSTYDLPNDDHVYGLAAKKDAEDAGHVISKWSVSKLSAPKKCDRNLVKTNVLALDSGNITARSMRAYALAHQDIRFKAPTSKLRNEDGTKFKDKVPFSGPYGIQTLRTDCPLSHVIEAHFTDFSEIDKDYPNIQVLRKKFRIPPPRETNATAGHNVRNKPAEKIESTFKMKRFLNIPSRLDLNSECPNYYTRTYHQQCKLEHGYA